MSKFKKQFISAVISLASVGLTIIFNNASATKEESNKLDRDDLFSKIFAVKPQF